MATQRSGTLVTYEDYCNLPDDERYEVIDGELIMVAAPRRVHQASSRNIGTPLDTYVKANVLGEMYYAPTDVILSDINVVQPDILFVSRERSHILADEGIRGAPDLVIEILSPSTAQFDTVRKRELYARFGVAEYWQVDTDDLSVVVLTLAGDDYETAGVSGLGDTLVSPLLTGFRLDVDDIFAA
ncbi:MAG: Uma2 family endonuclease [Dehalococcoidia bacterium]|nr:Uma2 family endonuclease [Dehalococcoidia bacterium]